MITNLWEKAVEESGKALIQKVILMRGRKHALVKRMRSRGTLLNASDSGACAQQLEMMRTEHIKRLSAVVAEHAEKGDAIVAIRPDWTNVKAVAEEIDRNLNRVKPPSHVASGRDREKDWQKIISNFERAEANRLCHNKGQPAQSWPRKQYYEERRAFRRLINSISFDFPALAKSIESSISVSD